MRLLLTSGLALAGLIAVLALGPWLIRPRLEDGFRREIEAALHASPEFEALRARVEGFAVTQEGPVARPEDRRRALSVVAEHFPLVLAADGDQIHLPAQLEVVERGGRLHFLDSVLPSAAWRAALRAWALDLRPDLEGRLRWEDIEIDPAASAPAPPVRGSWPEGDELLGDFVRRLEEPAVLGAQRTAGRAPVVLAGSLPDASWTTAVEATFGPPARPSSAATRDDQGAATTSWRWVGPEQPRIGPQVQQRGFVRAEPQAVTALLAEILADPATRRVLWHGGRGGWISWYHTGEIDSDRLQELARRSAALSGLPPAWALRPYRVDS